MDHEPTAPPDWRARPFAEFYTASYSGVHATMALYWSDRDLARDATDEAFVRAAAAWPRVRRMSSPRGWILTVAMNHARKQGSRDHRRRRAEQVGGVAPPDGEIHDRTYFESLIADLPERQRQAVVLRYVADLTQQDIADLMGVKRGTVSSLLATAADHLRAALGADPDREVLP